MGYASVLPFQLLTYNFSLSNDDITLSTVALDDTIATIVTPDWKYTPTYAFMSLIVNTRQNTNVNANSIDPSDNAKMVLTVDDVVFQTCGAWKDLELYTGASSWAYGSHKVLGTTNIASYIKPNTTYLVYVQGLKSYFNNLVLRNLSLELNMTFNI